MLKTLAFILSLFVAMPALAQIQQPPSSMEQAVTTKLQEEFNQNIQLRAALIQAQKEIAELKTKVEPSKTEAPKK